jgi:hypothetical protein
MSTPENSMLIPRSRKQQIEGEKMQSAPLAVPKVLETRALRERGLFGYTPVPVPRRKNAKLVFLLLPTPGTAVLAVLEHCFLPGEAGET